MKEYRAIPLPPPMGRTACTEPQCLYKDALYLFLYGQVGESMETEFIVDSAKNVIEDKHGSEVGCPP